MCEYVKEIISNHKLDDLDEVVEYLTSLALDDDTSVEDFRDSVMGFFEDLEVDDNQISITLDKIRNQRDASLEDQIPSLIEPSTQGNHRNPVLSVLTAADESCCESGPHIEASHENIAQSQLLQDPSSKTSWNCKLCTFENDLLLPVCEMCGNAAPLAPPPPKLKPTKQETDGLKKQSQLTNPLNQLILSDIQRRRQREDEEEQLKLLEVLSQANVSDCEQCRKMLHRHAVSSDKLDEYLLVEFIGFGLSAADAKLLYEYVDSLKERQPLRSQEENKQVVCASPSELNELMFLVPDRLINRAQVEYIYLVLAQRSMERASRYLVENFVEVSEPRLSANVRKVIHDAALWWENKSKPLLDEEEVIKSVKQTLMKRYDETPDDSKITHRPSASYGDGKKKGGAVRYIDGVKVNMKSAKDKFIVEDTTVEWDGGSRGRVKTKGKRGPGFV